LKELSNQSKQMKLSNEEFSHVINVTPLVAIDLILRNQQGQVLLGQRRNRPAQGYWFVPGGRIMKNERLLDALKRIAYTELGIELRSGQMIGTFDHLYDENVFGLADVTTHYVTIAYQVEIESDSKLIPDAQHEKFEWWDQEALLASPEVHEHTKEYFRANANGGFRCDYLSK
jgi:colanic acid biosynthesis protein WcaH